jgi:hypothetical protein
MNELNSFIALDKKNDVEMLNLISSSELQMKLCMFVLFVDTFIVIQEKWLVSSLHQKYL